MRGLTEFELKSILHDQYTMCVCQMLHRFNPVFTISVHYFQ
jgi:hypothetical protein